jgi:hypothetical protein
VAEETSSTSPESESGGAETEAAEASPPETESPHGESPDGDPGGSPESPKQDSPADGEPKGDPGPELEPAGVGEGEAEGGLDPQLIALCVVLWLVAMGILFAKWDRLRLDWHLGNVKETLDFEGRIDEEAKASIVEMATDNPEVIGLLGEEVHGPLANKDERYRVVVVKIVEEVPGPEALQVLILASSDFDARVRANTYVSLANRGNAYEGERADVLARVLGAVGPLPPEGESEPIARAMAIQSLARLAAPKHTQAVWLVWRNLRDLRLFPGSEPIRDASFRALCILTETSAEDIDLDWNAYGETWNSQGPRFEAWLAGIAGDRPAEVAAFEDGPSWPTGGGTPVDLLNRVYLAVQRQAWDDFLVCLPPDSRDPLLRGMILEAEGRALSEEAAAETLEAYEALRATHSLSGHDLAGVADKPGLLGDLHEFLGSSGAGGLVQAWEIRDREAEVTLEEGQDKVALAAVVRDREIGEDGQPVPPKEPGPDGVAQEIPILDSRDLELTLIEERWYLVFDSTPEGQGGHNAGPGEDPAPDDDHDGDDDSDDEQGEDEHGADHQVGDGD